MTREQQQFFVSMKTWAVIREGFSQAEKDTLNSAIEGEAICPRGVFLNADKLGPELVAKIRAGNKRTNALVQR